MALGSLESKLWLVKNSGEEMRGHHHPAGTPCRSFPSPISAFPCFINNLRRGRQEGEKDVTVSFLPLLSITHFLVPHPPLSPKYYFVLFNSSSNCMAPSWPRVSALASGHLHPWKSLPKAQSCLIPPARVSGQEGVPSSWLTKEHL